MPAAVLLVWLVVTPLGPGFLVSSAWRPHERPSAHQARPGEEPPPGPRSPRGRRNTPAQHGRPEAGGHRQPRNFSFGSFASSLLSRVSLADKPLKRSHAPDQPEDEAGHHQTGGLGHGEEQPQRDDHAPGGQGADPGSDEEEFEGQEAWQTGDQKRAFLPCNVCGRSLKMLEKNVEYNIQTKAGSWPDVPRDQCLRCVKRETQARPFDPKCPNTRRTGDGKSVQVFQLEDATVGTPTQVCCFPHKKQELCPGDLGGPGNPGDQCNIACGQHQFEGDEIKEGWSYMFSNAIQLPPTSCFRCWRQRMSCPTTDQFGRNVRSFVGMCCAEHESACDQHGQIQPRLAANIPLANAAVPGPGNAAVPGPGNAAVLGPGNAAVPGGPANANANADPSAIANVPPGHAAGLEAAPGVPADANAGVAGQGAGAPPQTGLPLWVLALGGVAVVAMIGGGAFFVMRPDGSSVSPPREDRSDSMLIEGTVRRG